MNATDKHTALERLNIFLASPADLAAERQVLHQVVAELNETLAPELGYVLILKEWSQARPAMGQPEDVILRQLEVETWDLFIGFLWLKFGNPTGNVDAQTGQPFASGTEEEFQLAYRAAQQTGKPEIMFYRKQPPADLSNVDMAQFRQVEAFFKNFYPLTGSHPGLYKRFSTPDEFEHTVRRDISNALWGRAKKPQMQTVTNAPDAIPAAQAPVRPASAQDDSAALPASGTATFLFTDIEGSTRLWEQHPQAMQVALARHDAILRRVVAAHHGHVVKTTGDGALAVFAQPAEGVGAMVGAQRALASEAWGEIGTLRVRMALHAGSAQARAGDFYGSTVNRAARLMAIGHGGQMLISNAAASLLSDDLPAEVGLRDLGEHRLRDFVRPERVYQLVVPGLPADFPALRAAGSFPTNLPAQLTSFVGRQQEMGDVKRLLGENRLITLTGPGGTGKTRLSLQVAEEMVQQFPDGAWLVELAPLSDPSLVLPTAATAVGLREQPGRPLLSLLADYLRPKRLLLVLDNCEHLVEACARLADVLLHSCPGLKVLASSREPLGIGGETTYAVPPLRTPDLAAHMTAAGLGEFESVRLFVERAQTVQPRFVLSDVNAPAVAQICRRLDGIPLAIELAAARIKLFAPEQIAARLDDRFRLLTGGSRTALPRQQTLRALIEWSYDLLQPPECVLTRRLSVFAGGWTFDAAERVCADIRQDGTLPNAGQDAILSHDILDLLTHLVDKSLVVVDEQEHGTRCRFLETIRQFAHDKLLESGERAQVRAQHLECYLALAQRAEPQLHHAEQVTWLERLESEKENVRAALDWALESDQSEKALALAGALWWFWYVRDHFGEARERMSAALARTAARAPDEARLKVMIGLGFIHYFAANIPEAQAILEAAVALSRTLGSQRGLAEALQFLGAVEFVVARQSSPPQFEYVRQIEEQSLALWQALGDKTGIGWTQNLLAGVAQAEGDLARARTLLEDGVNLRRAEGDWILLAYSLRRLAEIVLLQGNFRAAESASREGLNLLVEAKGQATIAASLAGFAGLALAQAHAARAVRLMGAVDAILVSTAAHLAPADEPPYKRNVEAARAQLGEAAFGAAWAEGRAMSIEQAIAYALDTEQA